MLTVLIVAGMAAAAPPEEFAERGKAAVVAGHLPDAIRTFRLGLSEHPGDRELIDLLEAARDLVGYPFPGEPTERMRPAPPSDWDRWVGDWELTALGVGFTALFATGLALRFTTRPRWAVPLAIFGLFGLVAVTATLVWPRERPGPLAVVAGKGVVLRTGNDDSYLPRVFHPLPRGTEGTVLGRRGGWVQLQLAGGAVGWVRESAVIE